MRSLWIATALFSSVVLAGCGRNPDPSQKSQQNQPPAATSGQAVSNETPDAAPPPAAPTPSPRADRSAATSHPAPKPVVPVPAVPSPESRVAETPTTTAPPAPKLPEFKEVTIPAGTSLPLTMTSTISSASADVEAPVSARLTNAVRIDGDTVLPAGSTFSGTVTDVERSGRVEGRAHIAFAFNQVRVRGEREELQTNPLTFEAAATKTKDAEKIGIGAVGGAVLGGILGGKKGAGKGAILGGGAGTGVVLATRGEEVTVNEGTNVTATLAQPMTIRIPVR